MERRERWEKNKNFMKKNKNEATELKRDDEEIRMQAMGDGKKKLHRWNFRPITALTISWIQRNEVFSDKHDLIWKSAAYAFLHCQPFAEIRRVVNDPDAFRDAVDCWIEKNIMHHNEIEAIAAEMNSAFDLYSSSVFTSSDAEGESSGN